MNWGKCPRSQTTRGCCRFVSWMCVKRWARPVQLYLPSRIEREQWPTALRIRLREFRRRGSPSHTPRDVDQQSQKKFKFRPESTRQVLVVFFSIARREFRENKQAGQDVRISMCSSSPSFTPTVARGPRRGKLPRRLCSRALNFS